MCACACVHVLVCMCACACAPLGLHFALETLAHDLDDEAAADDAASLRGLLTACGAREEAVRRSELAASERASERERVRVILGSRKLRDWLHGR